MTARGETVLVMGAGRSGLVADLLDDGRRVVAVDLSGTALRELTRSLRSADDVEAVVADARSFVSACPVDAWHDRAVFHFLVDDGDRAAYVAAAGASVRVGGHLLLATFAPDGPDSCSGLPVRRSSVDDLVALFADRFTLIEGFADIHVTPWGTTQRFTYALLARR